MNVNIKCAFVILLTEAPNLQIRGVSSTTNGIYVKADEMYNERNYYIKHQNPSRYLYWSKISTKWLIYDTLGVQACFACLDEDVQFPFLSTKYWCVDEDGIWLENKNVVVERISGGV